MSTGPFPEPVVATAGSTDLSAPLVVLLHGRGSHEREILVLAGHLPAGPAYAAVRAPIAEGGGYAWFANRGIGRPVAESLRATMDWFREWLDRIAPAGRPVVLVGFSGGAAFAGGLVLDDPTRYAGAAVLYGTLPFDAGVPTTPARLAGLPVMVAQGDQDAVIPRDLLDRTWDYLLGDSGAPTTARRDPVGHGIAPHALATLAGWLDQRLRYVATHGHSPVPQAGDAAWPVLPAGILPRRVGPRPTVSHTIPQQQTGDTAPAAVQEQLFARISALPGVSTGPSAISVPGARAFLVPAGAGTPAEAFIVPDAGGPGVGEFAHLHPAYDGSLHVALPATLAADAVAKGWAVPHPLAGVRVSPGMVMVYGPRDADELEVVSAIVRTSHATASGGGPSR